MRGLHAAAAELEREAGRAERAAAEEAEEGRLPKPDCARHALECRFAEGKHREVVAAASGATTLASAYWLARSSNELARAAFARLEQLPSSAALHEWRADQLRGEGATPTRPRSGGGPRRSRRATRGCAGSWPSRCA